jgi:hypothetical protein
MNEEIQKNIKQLFMDALSTKYSYVMDEVRLCACKNKIDHNIAITLLAAQYLFDMTIRLPKIGSCCKALREDISQQRSHKNNGEQ